MKRCKSLTKQINYSTTSKMKQTFAIAALAGLAMAKNLIGDSNFIKFQSNNNKSYKSM